MTIKDIADKLGLDASNLSGSLKGNPTLSRLQDVARVLGVEVYDLFEHREKEDITGFVEVNGEVCRIKSVEDLLAVSAKVSAITDPTLYKNVEVLRADVDRFVRECVKSGDNASMMGRLMNVEVFALIYNKDLFHLATLRGPVRTYDLCEYGYEGDYDLDGDEGLVSCILNDIESVLE